jgi:hypothetical protein
MKILKVMKEQDEPFDGICGFSQGGFMVSAVLKTLRYFSKRLGMENVPVPYFWINFASPKPSLGTFTMPINQSFMSSEHFFPGIDSIHFISQKDPGWYWMKAHVNFEKATVIEFDQGHRPVRMINSDKLN